MNATIINYDNVNGVFTIKTYGSIAGLTWTDANGNNFRSIAINLAFLTEVESYVVKVLKQIQANGDTKWVDYDAYDLISDSNEVRYLNTGKLITNPDGTNAKDPTNLNQTSGVLVVGQTYTITNYLGTDDFSNVANVQSGTINTNGCVFIATGAAPTTWTNLTELLTSVPSALDPTTGAIINPFGYVTNGKYFTIAIGYNPTHVAVNVFNYIYNEIAIREQLTIIPTPPTIPSSGS